MMRPEKTARGRLAGPRCGRYGHDVILSFPVRSVSGRLDAGGVFHRASATVRCMPSVSAAGIALASLLVAGLGCSSAANPTGTATFASQPLVVVTSASGALTIEVRTAPQPAARGANTVELTVKNSADGLPRDGLGVSMVPWMPAMNHGTSAVPVITPSGNGKYVVTQVELYMAGHWELQTSFSGTLTDNATPALDVP